MVKRLTITVRDWLFEMVERTRKNEKKQSRSEFIETILSKYFIRRVNERPDKSASQ